MSLHDRLQEAVAERKTATDSSDFVRARAREKVLREALWSEALHPRGRGGKWIFSKMHGAERYHNPTALASGAHLDQLHDKSPPGDIRISDDPLDKLWAKGLRFAEAAAAGMESEMSLLEDQLQEAVQIRKTAPDSATFVRAYARERVIRRQLEERQVSTKERATLEKKGHAMPGGRYPIRHAGDVAAAVKAFGRGNPPDKEAIRQHIIKRAKDLGVHDTHIPDSWKKGGGS